MKSNKRTLNFFLEVLRTQKWMLLITSFLMFLQYPVAFMLWLKQTYSYVSQEYIATYVKEYFIYDSSFNSSRSPIIFTAFLIGIVAGIWAFSYLHNKTQVGLYHSLPISRNQLIVTKFLAFTICFLIPLIMGNVLLGIIVLIRGYGTKLFLAHMLVYFYYNIMVFWMGYLLAAIAMLLTGKMLVGILGTFVFAFYGPVLAVILQVFADYAFITQPTYASDSWGIYAFLRHVSPMFFLENPQWDSVIVAATALVVVIVLWWLQQHLMKLRPSEVAGRPIAYYLFGLVSKIIICIMGTLGGAVFLISTTYGFNAWTYFGAFFGLVASYLIVQLLYGVDVKHLLKDKISIPIIAVASIVVILIFQYDLFGYDTYLPNYDKIADINIEFTEKNQYSTALLEENLYDAHMGVNHTTYQLMETIIESAEVATAGITDYYSTVEGTVTIYVEYKLNSGQTVTRTYQPYIEDVNDSLKYLWVNEEFLNIMYPMRILESDFISSVYIDVERGMYVTDEDSLFEGDVSKQQKFMEYYKMDLLEMNASVLEEVPVASVTYYGVSGYYNGLIYPSFTNALSYLESEHIQLQSMLTAENMESITLYEYDENTIEFEKELNAVTYTDKKSMDVLLEDMVVTDLVTIFMDIDDTRDATVLFDNEDSAIGYSFIKY